MRVRSVTIGANLTYPLEAARFRVFEQFQARARSLFERAGLEVQTVRLATQPFPEMVQDPEPSRVAQFAVELEGLCLAHGIDYCSIGTVEAAHREANLAYLDAVPEVIRQTEVVFATASVASSASGFNLAATVRAAQVIADIARTTPQGFGNLRFAVLANCEPGSPFFPVSYHRGPDTSFSIATEAADLAVAAFTRARTLDEAQHNLRVAVEGQAQIIEGVCSALATEFDYRFGGIDFSMAPYPETARSVGHAIEKLGVDVFGSNGTLFAVALMTRVLREARYSRCGFCGVMLPVLEDSTLAQRSTRDLYTLDSLLLYSAVCGTGLDTIPLPGDVSEEDLAAILLDLCTLAVVVDKPLTARLMPVPGKAVGDLTDFDFSYFANARVMDVQGRGSTAIFARNHFFELGS
jgi:uncharacterized protein (UPF0210 family)